MRCAWIINHPNDWFQNQLCYFEWSWEMISLWMAWRRRMLHSSGRRKINGAVLSKQRLILCNFPDFFVLGGDPPTLLLFLLTVEFSQDLKTNKLWIDTAPAKLATGLSNILKEWMTSRDMIQPNLVLSNMNAMINFFIPKKHKVLVTLLLWALC